MRKTSSTDVEITVDAASCDDPVSRLILAAQDAVRAALREHKRAGNSVAGWKDGKVV